MSSYPPALVDAVAVELAAMSGSPAFPDLGEPDAYPNALYRRMYRGWARRILDVLDREGALYRNEEVGL